MDLDPSESQYLKQKAETLRSLTTSSFSSAISNLTASSRAIPSNKDFHFFYNFDEFKTPVKDVISRSQSMLKDIGSASDIWGKQISFPEDMEDAYVWLVNVNDEVLERFDVSVAEFQRERKKEEEFGRQKMSFMMEDADSGFQQVYGKKKKGVSKFASAKGKSEGPESAVKVASGAKQANGTKPRVPFHIPTIKKPQDQFNIMVNNSNQPFEHVWLKRSEDGFRFVHPLESHSASDFVERNVRDVEPVKPLPMESVPFKLVQEVKDLKDLAAKLRSVNEFSVDLEHNQYRSFQGLTCLMQISTRNEDFVVDTLKLRIHIGPYLREVFKDPSKRKVMHGADRDVLWLQRDFGIYICNLFDTGQASRVLQLERKSLEYLLDHLCGVSAKKEYQNADWRLRPLPDEMLRYAREDTHYLLYIYDLLKARLLLESLGSENSEDLLAEVYARSYDICMQLYEKELLSDTSYLHIYGLQAANFNAQQLAIVAGLCEWRDGVARAEDESTGYILPNKILLEIAKQMPMTVGKLRGLMKYKHPYVEHSLGSVVNIIRHSIKNAAAFESVAKQLMEGQMQVVSRMQASAEIVTFGTEASPLVPDSMELIGDKTKKSTDVNHVRGPEETLTDSMELASTGQVKNGLSSQLSGFPSDRLTANGQIRISREDHFVQLPEKVNGATIEVQKKPSRAFGALFGKAALKRKSDPFKKEDQDKRLEQIKASVNLPFHLFPVKKEELSKSVAEEPTTTFEVPREDNLKANGKLEEIILVEGDSGSEEKESVDRNSESTKDKDGSTRATALEIDDEDEPMSLSDLSSSFESCFRSISQQRKGRQVKNNRPQQPVSLLQIKPFDYAAALRFGEDPEGPSGAGGKGSVDGRDRPASRRGGAAAAGLRKEDAPGELPQGRRRHAFPASGNRCATFR